MSGSWSNVLFVNPVKLVDLSDAKFSIHNCNFLSTTTMMMAPTNDDTTTLSVASADSTIDDSVNSEPEQASGSTRKSALKQSSSPNRLAAQRIRIRFHENVQRRWHFGRHEYTTEELDACWFRGEEYQQIASSCCKNIQRLEEQQQLDDAKRIKNNNNKKFCSRGLESHTHLAAIAKNRNRRVAWDAVLDEQYDQVSLGAIDEEAIASCYRDCSSSCRLWAIHVGQQDQRVADLIYDSMLDSY
jgi:hypothetical protein